jgi:hypothetical protein
VIQRLLPALAMAFVALPAAAQHVESAYTDLDLNLCSVVTSDDFGTTWACPGYKGLPVMVAEGDLRFFVSYGLRSPDEPAAGQTPPPFNHLGPRIEWRLTNAAGGWRPFATILRWYVADPEDSGRNGEILVVTRLEPGATCHIAYVDALASKDANQLARDIADKRAADFDCADAPELAGTFKAW